MIEIWFADEARIGQKNKITRRWAKRGTLVRRSDYIRDGLIAATEQRKTRVRMAGDRSTIAIKIKLSSGRRIEFEYEIPQADAEEIMVHCGGAVIEKVRHYAEAGKLTWEIDEYQG